MQHLREVLTRLRSGGLHLKSQKCHLLQREVLFPGYVIAANGICPDPAKAATVKHYPPPTDVTKVRQFLGLVSYYKHFIPAFSRIASPLLALTKKDAQIYWLAECQATSEELKQMLTTAPVLAYLQFGPGKCFILETNASTEGLGAILSQEQYDGTTHPIAYASQSVNKHKKNYSISELETLGLVWAACLILSSLSDRPPMHGVYRQCSLPVYRQYSQTIGEVSTLGTHHSGDGLEKPGKANSNADALSRNHGGIGRIGVVNTAGKDGNCTLDLAVVHEMKMGDIMLSQLLEYLSDGTLSSDKNQARRVVLESKLFSVLDGVLHFEGQAQSG